MEQFGVKGNGKQGVSKGRTKLKLFQPPHLYYVATLPSETNTDAGINVQILSQNQHKLIVT